MSSLEENYDKEEDIDNEDGMLEEYEDFKYNFQTNEFTVGEYFRRIKSGKINIPRFEVSDIENKYPRFQRSYAWSNDTRDLFIDSIYKRFPIPFIYLYQENEKEPYLVIDGGHRLTTIFNYLEGEFALGDKVCGPLKGKKFDDLEDYIKDYIEDTPIRAYVIFGNKDNKSSQLFEVFVRFNQGAKPLTPMEIRVGLIYSYNNMNLLEKMHSFYDTLKPIHENSVIFNRNYDLKELALLLVGISFFDREELIKRGKSSFLDYIMDKEISLDNSLNYEKSIIATFELIKKTISKWRGKKEVSKNKSISHLELFFIYVYDLILKNKKIDKIDSLFEKLQTQKSKISNTTYIYRIKTFFDLMEK